VVSRVYLQAGTERVHACVGEEGASAPRDGSVWRLEGVFFHAGFVCVCVGTVCAAAVCKRLYSGGGCTHRCCTGACVPPGCAQAGGWWAAVAPGDGGCASVSVALRVCERVLRVSSHPAVVRVVVGRGCAWGMAVVGL